MKLEEIKTTHAVLPLRHPIRSAIHHIDAIHVLITEIRGEGGHEGFGVALAFSPHHIQAMDAVVRDVAPPSSISRAMPRRRYWRCSMERIYEASLP